MIRLKSRLPCSQLACSENDKVPLDVLELARPHLCFETAVKMNIKCKVHLHSVWKVVVELNRYTIFQFPVTTLFQALICLHRRRCLLDPLSV